MSDLEIHLAALSKQPYFRDLVAHIRRDWDTCPAWQEEHACLDRAAVWLECSGDARIDGKNGDLAVLLTPVALKAVRKCITEEDGADVEWLATQCVFAFLDKWGSKCREPDPNRKPSACALLSAIAHNKCVDEWRRIARRKPVSLDELGPDHPLLNPKTDPGNDPFLDREWVETALQKLDGCMESIHWLPNVREFFDRYYHNEESIESIAGSHGCKPERIRQQIHRARNALRACMGQKE